MASLKEIKTRITSVKSTHKITSAMKMVASAKLHGAQRNIFNMRSYEELLQSITATFVATLSDDFSTSLTQKRQVQRVAYVVYASNTSLCGAYNTNVLKCLQAEVEKDCAKGAVVAGVYTFGKKVEKGVKKMGFSPIDFSQLNDAPTYIGTRELAEKLVKDYLNHNVDRVVLIYHKFISAGHQKLQTEHYLPIDLSQLKRTELQQEVKLDYIVEPNKDELIEDLLPKMLYLKIFTALLDSLASEHAARMLAMQMATDNAEQLLHDLTLQYNKGRQQAITAELLDIVGGSMN